MRRALSVGFALSAVLLAACAPAVERHAPTPEERAVVVETTGCGDAGDRRGSGFVAGDGVVVTAAHLVVRADVLTASVAGAEPVRASLRYVDLDRDVAVLTIPPTGHATVRTAFASAGDEGSIVGSASSGTVSYEVDRVVDLTIERVLGTDLAMRRGYDLDAVTGEGDSGAGVYDTESRLVGMVFAVSEIDGSTWATAASEIEPVIEAAAEAASFLECDPGQSRVVLP